MRQEAQGSAPAHGWTPSTAIACANILGALRTRKGTGRLRWCIAARAFGMVSDVRWVMIRCREPVAALIMTATRFADIASGSAKTLFPGSVWWTDIRAIEGVSIVEGR